MERLHNLRPLCCDTTDLLAALPETLDLLVVRAEPAAAAASAAQASPLADPVTLLRALREKLRRGSHVAVLETTRSRAKKLAKDAAAAGFRPMSNKLHHKVVVLALEKMYT